MNVLLDWPKVEKKLWKNLGRSEENCVGVKAYPALCMFKILLLQSWYDLSDMVMEESLCDRYSFSRFEVCCQGDTHFFSKPPRKQVNIEMVTTYRKEDEAHDCQVTVSYSQDSEVAWICKGSRYH